MGGRGWVRKIEGGKKVGGKGTGKVGKGPRTRHVPWAPQYGDMVLLPPL